MASPETPPSSGRFKPYSKEFYESRVKVLLRLKRLTAVTLALLFLAGCADTTTEITTSQTITSQKREASPEQVENPFNKAFQDVLTSQKQETPQATIPPASTIIPTIVPPIPPPTQTEPSFDDILNTFNARYSALKREYEVDKYQESLENSFTTLSELQANENKFIVSKQFNKAISDLVDKKYALRPKLIEKYREQGLDPYTIEKLVAQELGDIDSEIEELENKWQDQLKDYKTKIDLTKIDISFNTAKLCFALTNVQNEMDIFQYTIGLSMNLQQFNDTNDHISYCASALCNDGTFSYSQQNSGTCSYHGGVARWL